MNKEPNIEDLFAERLGNAEVTPSANLWQQLEQNLDHQNLEGVFQTAFTNATVQPMASVWKKISTALAWKSFFTFNVSKFNIYYASIISAIAGFTAYELVQNSNQQQIISEQIATQTEKISQTTQIEVQPTKAETEALFSNIVSDLKIDTTNVVENVHKLSATVEKHEAEQAQKESKFGKRPNKTENSAVDWSHVIITGNNSVCQHNTSTYSVEGLPAKANIQWNVPKAAKNNRSGSQQISLTWLENGNHTLAATIKIDNEKRTFNYAIKVEGVAIPTIKGKTKVCQGMEKQLYYVDETINKEVSYLWESQNNPIDQIGNKYINVDWTKSGKDTLTVTKINTTTGCKSMATVGILVYPQPKVDFEIHPLGDSEYEFVYTETQKKGNSYEWIIEGVEYHEAEVTHTSTTNGSSFVNLAVTDKNGCKTSLQKEVDFNKNLIAVPSKFSPNSGRYFMPLTNAELSSYKLEIYNARNEKIWETTELTNGKPSAGWDGKLRGTNLPRGKYLWKISATFDDGTQWKGITQPNGSCKPSGIFILEN